MNHAPDPYGEEYDDWEDPYAHAFLTMCTGCALCANWPGKTYDQIRTERINQVEARRLREGRDEETPDEVARADRAHWDN